jgi:starvation-inducible DNA-binding protein
MSKPPETGLTAKARQTLARILSHVLEEECSLSATTSSFRWKISGPNLQSLNRLFEEQRRQIDSWLEQLRARTRAVGGTGTLAATSVSGTSAEQPALPVSRMIAELLERHEKMAQQLRDDVVACGARLGDRATAELLNQLAEFHETTAWMLRTLRDNPDTAR